MLTWSADFNPLSSLINHVMMDINLLGLEASQRAAEFP